MAQIQIELTAEKENGNGYFYASLNLPATKMQIENAKQQARYTDSDTLYRDISVYESTDISLDNVRLDTTSIEELNFLAKRLDSMSRQEQIVYEAFFDLEELGRFAVENDFITDLEEVPDSVLKYLDYVVIGQEQRDKDDGYLVRGCYVALGNYGYPEPYDGEHIPDTGENEDAVFRLLVSSAPVENPSEVMDSAQWLELPISIDRLHEFAEKIGAVSIEDCVYYDFQSGIPQINEDVFDSMDKIESLNIIANEYLMLPEAKRALFKAVVEAENIGNLEEMQSAFKRLDKYEFCPDDENADEFFKRYLAYHAPTDFDIRWLEEVSSHDDAQKLLKTLGAKVTNYGIVSAYGKSLYENVAFPTPQSESHTDDFELIEIVGQPALFSDSRISDTEVPNGLHRYDLRVGDDDFCDGAIEKNVYVNYGGSILLQQPLDLGADGYIQLDEDSSPNFTGEEMTAEEFASTDFTEYDSEDFNQTGGMSL